MSRSAAVRSRRAHWAAACVVLAVVALAGAFVRPAGTRPPSTGWRAIGGGLDHPVGELGLARLGPKLHVAWIRRTGGNSYDLMDTQISAAGAIGATSVVVGGWYQLNEAALVATPDTPGSQLSTFFQGTKTVVTGEPYSGIVRATSGDGGATWSSTPPSSIFREDGSYADLSAATSTPHGYMLVTWPGRGGQAVAYGDRPNPTVLRYGPSSCCLLGQNVAAFGDRYADSAAWVAWCAQNDAPSGVWAQKLDIRVPQAEAQPVPYPDADGTAHVLPGSQGVLCESDRVPLAVRRGDVSFYVADAAAPAARRVLLWRLGTPSRKPLVVAAGSDPKSRVALAAAPDGRLWVAWRTFHGASTLHLRRSNRTATELGAQVDVKSPPGAVEVSHVDLSAQTDRVDAVVSFSFVDGVRGNPYYTQIFPGLTLTVRGGTVVSFRVTEAGDPVAGATVAVAGRKLRTDGRGEATADLKPGRYRAVASKPGYVSATGPVRSK